MKINTRNATMRKQQTDGDIEPRKRSHFYATQTAVLAFAAATVFAGCGGGIASNLGGCSPAPCGGTPHVLGYVTGLQRVTGGVEISLRIENRYTQAALFIPEIDAAVLTDAGERLDLAPGLDAACFQSMDPDIQIQPDQTVDVRKPLCFEVPSGVTVASLVFNAGDDVTVPLEVSG